MFASTFETMNVSAVLTEVWQAIGSEVIIFLVTLAFAMAVRSLPKLPAGKDKEKTGTQKTISSSSKLGKSGGTLASQSPAAPSKRSQGAQAAPTRSSSRNSLPSPTGSTGSTSGGGGARPRSVVEVVNEIVERTKEQTGMKFAHWALQLYQDELLPRIAEESHSLKDLMAKSRHQPLELYSTLVNCAIRVGKHHLVEAFCEDMSAHGISRPLSFYESTMRQLASQKQYHLALAMYDLLEKDGLRPSAVTCSCLIGFAAEVGELQRAVDFFESLASMTTPSIRAYMTVLRVHAKRGDAIAAVETLRHMQRCNVTVDSLALNIVLATCVTADQSSVVQQLVSEAEAAAPPATDIVSYNTLLKAYAQRGDANGASDVIRKLKARGLRPNAITFNTAMDAMVRANRLPEAWLLVDEMRTSGLRADKFTCSILIKGLAKVTPTAAEVHSALALLSETESACDVSLRNTLYHAVLEAAMQVKENRHTVAAAAFAQLRRAGVVPSAAAQRSMLQSLPGSGVQQA